MADTERNEDQKISRCLQEAFGYTDEQLLKQLDQANETLKDVTFDGAEDRIMKKIMARKAEMEKEIAAPETETERKITLVKAEPESGKGKKIVRFGKKKVLATVALVAVIAGMLGGTAVGKRSYFFRKEQKREAIAIINNDKNMEATSSLDEAYDEIEKKLACTVLKMEYYPEEMEFKEYRVYKNEAELKFVYKDNVISVLQIKNTESASVNLESDRNEGKTVYNKWIKQQIEYNANVLENEKIEYGATIVYNNMIYYITGCVPEVEYERILENLNYF